MKTLFAIGASFLVLWGWLFASPAFAHTYETIYSFPNKGDGPSVSGRFTIDGTGTLYGAVGDLKPSHGRIFALAPNAAKTKWNYELLYAFCRESNCQDGAGPNGVILDKQGHVFGTTDEGGSGCIYMHGKIVERVGCGILFELVPNAAGTKWKEKVLYNFCRVDCSHPAAPPLMDKQGNFYVTWTSDGDQALELSPQGTDGSLSNTLLYEFEQPPGKVTDGLLTTPLVMDKAGNLYGTTNANLNGSSNSGGPGCEPPEFENGCGVVFELSPNAHRTAWTLTVLHQSCTNSDCSDGGVSSGVILDREGNVYGTSPLGGTFGQGLVYELTPNGDGTWRQTVLYSFCAEDNCSDGALPSSALTLDASGTLYGMTAAGGTGAHCAAEGGCGTVFQLTPNADRTQWVESVLHNFCSTGKCRDGSVPGGLNTGLAMDRDGDLFGTTTSGGEALGGVVFMLRP